MRTSQPEEGAEEASGCWICLGFNSAHATALGQYCEHVRTMNLINIGNDIKRRREDAVEPDINRPQQFAKLQDR